MADYAKILKKGLYANYKALPTKDPNVLYFCTDTRQIFMGESLLSAALEVVTTRPETAGKEQTVYLMQDTGNVEAYVDGNWTVLVKGTVQQITSDATHDTIPTTKAVYDYIRNITSGTNQEVIDARGTYDSLNARLDDYQSILDDLQYKAITINTFSNNVNTVEMGRTITDVTLNWTLNKTPKTLKLDGSDLDVNLRTKSLSGLSITANKTFSLVATDNRDATANKNTTITFYNGVYYGVADAGESYDSAFILALTKNLQGSRAKTFTVNAGVGKHIFYCVPTRFGACSFNVGGFDGGFSKVSTISFTNDSGYTESYDIYMSDNANLGNTTVKVS